MVRGNKKEETMRMLWTEKKTFVEFLHAGNLSLETTTAEVGSRDLGNLSVPRTVFAVEFFDKLVAVFLVDGQEITTESEPIDRSCRYYFGGRVMNLAEASEFLPCAGGFIENMRRNGWDKIVQCRFGNLHPFEEGDQLVA